MSDQKNQEDEVVLIEGHRYMTIGQVQTALGVTKNTALKYIDEYDIPKYRFGDKLTRYRESDIATMIRRVE